VVNRPAEVAAILTAPLDSAPGQVCDRIFERFTRQLAGASAGQPRWREVVVTLPVLRRALAGSASHTGWDEPFRWKPAFVRRSLGLAAIEACRSGRFRSPAEAVGPVADQAVAAWQRSGWRTFHWEPWLSYQPTGARAVVLAEAARWSTSLWCAVDWAALGSKVAVGGPDEQWRCPPNGAVRLRGRVDVRVTLPFGMALVVTATGVPPPSWQSDLAFPALVAALSRPRRPLPCRVMGIWPDAGAHRALDIGPFVLERMSALVVEAVRTMVGSAIDGSPDDGSGSSGATGGAAGRYDGSGVADVVSGAAGSSRARAAFASGLPAAVSGMFSTSSS
jgi:hypothetical protein